MLGSRLLIILLLISGSVSAQSGGPPPAVVRTDTATLKQMAPQTQVPGTVVSLYDARLSAEVEGNLISVADVGSDVVAGDVVAVIDDVTLVLRQKELVAEQTRAQARLRFLAAEVERLQTLAQSNLASATDLDQTRSERDVADSELQVARVRLDQVSDQIARTRIKAPFDGTVVERLARIGERVNVGNEVVRLVNSQDLEVVARAPLDYMDFVKRGQAIDLQTSLNRKAAGVVRTIVAVGSEQTHVFELRLDIEAGLFPVGQTLRVWIPTSDLREVLAVPRDALVLRTDGAAIFVVADDQTAQRIPVVTGVASGDLIEVQGELTAGDRVIVRGNERLQPGQAVTILEGS